MHTFELYEVVEKALKNEKTMKLKRKKVVKEYCGNMDGKASERIAKLIERTVGK